MKYASLLILIAVTATLNASTLPNIVLILADDLGYGDVGCYNPESKVPTPNLDRLAREGVMFMDAHSPSTVCTPTRYSIMTGRMAFRTGKRGVFVGIQGPCLIEPDRLTLPQMLREKGYQTSMVGKWHIGMSFFDKEGNLFKRGGVNEIRQADFSRVIPDSPVHRGFDYFYGTVACPGTDFLYAYIENDRVPIPPTTLLDRSTLPKHPYANDCRRGLVADGFDLEQLDMVFLQKSLVQLQKFSKSDKPFFLFHSTHAAHLPSFAAPKYKGKTNAGPHGDFIFMLDDVVGQLTSALEKYGLADNTLVIVTSDNGPEVPTVLDMRKKYQHDGANPWRGVKRDNWEGGHRVPMIARWPGRVTPNTKSNQTTNLTDIMATCAEIINYELPNEAAEDSVSMLAAFTGEQEPIRKFTLHQTISLALGIREGNWKYLDHEGSGGNNYTRAGEWGMRPYAIETKGGTSPAQLYDLEDDPGETTNLYQKHPEIAKRLKTKLDEFVKSGRSVPPR